MTTIQDETTERELALVKRHVMSYHDTANLYAHDVDDVPAFEHHGPNLDCRIRLKERNGSLEWWICTIRYGHRYYVHGNGDDPEEAFRHATIELERAVERRVPTREKRRGRR